MKILALYGFHKEETDFGKLVCDEYNKRYSPEPSLLVIQPVQNSAHRRDTAQEQIAKQEISDLIWQYHPEVLMDIHHSSGIEPEIRENLKQSLYSPIISKQKKKGKFVSLVDKLLGIKPVAQTECKPDSFDRLTKRLLQPMLVSYWNPEINPALFDYLSRQTDLGAMPYLREKEICVSGFETATENKTAYISVEAMLNGRGSQIYLDAHYYDTAERLIELIHRIDGFVIVDK